MAAEREHVSYLELDADHGLILNATAETASIILGFLTAHARW